MALVILGIAALAMLAAAGLLGFFVWLGLGGPAERRAIDAQAEADLRRWTRGG